MCSHVQYHVTSHNLSPPPPIWRLQHNLREGDDGVLAEFVQQWEDAHILLADTSQACLMSIACLMILDMTTHDTTIAGMPHEHRMPHLAGVFWCLWPDTVALLLSHP